jgi:hypothetical protein
VVSTEVDKRHGRLLIVSHARKEDGVARVARCAALDSTQRVRAERRTCSCCSGARHWQQAAVVWRLRGLVQMLLSELSSMGFFAEVATQ